MISGVSKFEEEKKCGLQVLLFGLRDTLHGAETKYGMPTVQVYISNISIFIEIE